MIRLLVTVGVVAVGVTAVVGGITSYLTLDDLKDCDGPSLLVPKCAPADVIVAISGGDTQARTAEAVKLYKAGWAGKMIFSGAALDMTGPSNAEAMRTQAISAGVPPADIVLDSHAADTSQNAQGALGLLDRQDKRVILVTSPYHQRRASIEFQKVLGNDITVVNHPTSSDKSWGPYWWTTFDGWILGVTETLKAWVVSTWR